ncbi:MAG: hypothetical protein QOJ83_1829 [Frankiales bacterium]|jgi:hypothetical protein|nr:hypothetical protein [Frankiales bacterium]
MVHSASAQVSEAVVTTGPDSPPDPPDPTEAEPTGGETAADAAEPPEEPAGLWRRLRRSRIGMAALLPALLLAAVFVGLPFSGTVSHPVDQPTTSSAPAHPGPGR